MFIFVLLAADKAAAAPITFNTALPISKGEIIFREQLIYGRAKEGGREMTRLTFLSVAAYGVTPDLALFAVLPVLRNKLSMPGLERQATGLGDMRLFSRYTIYRRDFRGGTFRFAPFAGLELPTGEHQERDERGLLPPALQAGSGSWDIVFGLIGTYATVDFNLDAQVSWQENRKAGGIETGDVFRTDVSVQYRLYPQEIGDGEITGFLYGVLEASLVHEGKNRTANLPDPNSGGTKLFISPGLQYAATRCIAEATVQLPVLQNLNGANLKQDYVLRAGFRINF
ncbi:transporter [Luteithermobacter gelatinilyticus]|uniref:transporter n=1 Tax=Luteithermobacter gelatinilyticus TaxID=2582913 RepID=UPI001106AC82|nr:transporter [Luteithermobacter gelatinilyticus]